MTVVAGLVVLLFGTAAACNEAPPAQSEHDKSLDSMTSDFNGGQSVVRTHTIEADGITVKTTYSTTYSTSNWQITTSKLVDIKLEVEYGAGKAPQMTMEHMHADVSLLSDNQSLNGWPQDSMDSSIHGGTQAGFAIDPEHPFNVVFAIEGYSQTLISGWGFALGGYGTIDISEQRLTEDNLRKSGKVVGNKFLVVWVLTIKGPNDTVAHEYSFADEFKVPVG